ncbi:SMP-30/gluconolactonase/LRE family protein [Spirosoma sp. KUDC1026]|uniref:SMP-30/gluconolactonase/LRE family protein n=1 Tax=Spirosoma sp. KUDC1026 TaxID=2745947 RepID=UPI00159BB3B3|nr:SMP-30/gluconolactonase/LRE family protein [Spirosoma sp. KUDC1026]QKZ11615.1 SMP-30/gluconolactonase/LRE family protein [Spirosoma sp. KUDC1026]
MGEIRVLATGLKFPGGPTFDEAGSLWCTEQEGENLFCRQKDGSTKRIKTGGKPSGAVARDGYIWFCDSGKNTICRINTISEIIETMVSELSAEPLNYPNNLLVDAAGQLIFSCPGPSENPSPGYVAVYTSAGKLEIIAEGLSYPSGLALLPDNTTLLITETHRQRIWQGYWDSQSLSWENLRVWATVIEGTANATMPGPNGLAVGPDGNLYVAVFGAGVIRVFSEDGLFVHDIDLPGSNPSDCVFDPSGELGLVVTETEKGELLSVRL